MDTSPNAAAAPVPVPAPPVPAPAPAPAPPPASAESPVLTESEKTEARIRGACALVAAEINVRPEDIHKEIDPQSVCEFATAHSIEPIVVVREVCKRKALINAGVSQIAKEVGTDFPSVFNVLLLEWCTLCETSENSNRELLEVMREACHARLHETNQDTLTVAKPKDWDGMQLHRLSAFKRDTTLIKAKDKRSKDAKDKQARAREKKVQEKRNQNSN